MPPFILRGDGGDGRGPARWRLWLIVILALISAACCTFLLVSGLLRWQLPVLLPLALTGLYHLNTRRLPFDVHGPDVPPLALWAVAAGAVGFVIEQMAVGSANWVSVMVGAGGIGGAAGVLTWISATVLLGSVAMVHLIWPMLRPGGWDRAA